MKGFIEVTYNEHPLLLNVSCIVRIHPKHEKTEIYMLVPKESLSCIFTVNESYDAVKALISEASK